MEEEDSQSLEGIRNGEGVGHVDRVAVVDPQQAESPRDPEETRNGQGAFDPGSGRKRFEMF